MIVGHYAASFLGKAMAPQVPLWHLMIAAQVVDFAWATFILVGIEHSAIVPGATRAFPFDFYDIPYSHSLLTLGVWVIGSFWLYGLLIGRRWRQGALVFALVVASHWFLDLLVHAEDLPLTPTSDIKFGFALWNLPLFEFCLEFGLLLLCVAIYARANNISMRRLRSVELWILVVMLCIHGYFYSGYYTHSMRVVAVLVLIGYAFVVWFTYRQTRTFRSQMAVG